MVYAVLHWHLVISWSTSGLLLLLPLLLFLLQAPRDKLVCILNCCRMLNSMLTNRSKAEGVGESGNSGVSGVGGEG